MTTIKTLLEFGFLGGFFGACLGLIIGGVFLPPILWPDSNLGPPAGGILGLLIGALSGLVLGLILAAILTLQQRRDAVLHSSKSSGGEVEADWIPKKQRADGPPS